MGSVYSLLTEPFCTLAGPDTDSVVLMSVDQEQDPKSSDVATKGTNISIAHSHCGSIHS